jgi:ABC-2 type transport system permease protein
MRSEKSVMGVSMLFLFPLTFLSSVYVDPATMPGWLQSFVNVNPISTLAEAVRALMAGGFDGDAMMWTFGYGIVFTAVFGALTMRLYNRK